MKDATDRWTLDELTARVAGALSEGYEGAASGRVRDVPDRRTIRYYTTLGLVDRPLEMRGRTALYGRRHLLQIVAIKKLQATGYPLLEVQERLTGRTDSELAGICGWEIADGTEGSEASASASPGSARAFWKQAPEAHSTAGQPADEGSSVPTRGAATERPGMFIGLPLREGVTLLLAPSRPLDPRDVAAIEAAAGPLLRVLSRHRLIESAEGGDHP
jgi:DNA-binding transcriptional MerR regulator